MNSFQLVKDTLQQISKEEAAAYEEMIKGYRRLIDEYAFLDQKAAYEKASKFGWYLTFADEEIIQMEKESTASYRPTLTIYDDGSSLRGKIFVNPKEAV